MAVFGVPGLHRHQPVCQPQGQAINHQQPLRAAVLGQHLGQLARFLYGQHAWHALGAVALVARNALAHFRIPGLAGRHQRSLIPGIRLQPLARQQLRTTGFAAFLPAQYQLGTRHDEGDCACRAHGDGLKAQPSIVAPKSAATADGQDGNQA